MTPSPVLSPDNLRRWLAAEQIGVADDADAALADLLSGEPLAAPSVGFADRVMARALAPAAAEPQAVEAARRARAWRPRGTRRLTAGRRRRVPAAVGGALAGAAAVGVLLAPFWLPLVLATARGLLSTSTVAWTLQAAIGAALGLADLVAALVSCANTVLLLVLAVAKPLATPPMLALAAASLMISVISLRSLRALIQRDRRWVNVDPI